jgi:hypothetical protein
VASRAWRVQLRWPAPGQHLAREVRLLAAFGFGEQLA